MGLKPEARLFVANTRGTLTFSVFLHGFGCSGLVACVGVRALLSGLSDSIIVCIACEVFLLFWLGEDSAESNQALSQSNDLWLGAENVVVSKLSQHLDIYAAELRTCQSSREPRTFQVPGSPLLLFTWYYLAGIVLVAYS